jgi:Putative auto-transporter adhesin, head GIN domain
MKNLLLITMVILFSANFMKAQEMVTQKRDVSNFKEIRVGGGIDLYLTQGNTEKLTLTAPSDKINKIITEVKDGVLEIKMERNNWNFSWGWSNKAAPKVKLTFKDIDVLKAGGGSDVYSEGRLLFDNIQIDAGGGSDVFLDITADKVNCSASGGSDATLKGSARFFNGNSSGGSDLKAKELRTQSCKISSSGGSDAYVWAESELMASASGGSDIYYYGKPTNVKVNKSGGSDITRK